MRTVTIDSKKTQGFNGQLTDQTFQTEESSFKEFAVVNDVFFN